MLKLLPRDDIKKMKWLVNRILECNFGNEYQFQEVKAMIEDAGFTFDELELLGVDSDVLSEVKTYLSVLKYGYTQYRNDWCKDHQVDPIKVDDLIRQKKLDSVYMSIREFEDELFFDERYMKKVMTPEFFQLYNKVIEK